MYSDLVEQLAKSLNAKDLILAGVTYKQGSGSELNIYGMCKLETLENNLQALAVMREMWTPDSTIPKPGAEITVHIRNMNSAVELKCLNEHPVLCTFNCELPGESLEILPWLS